MTLPITLTDGADADPVDVMSIFDDLEGRLPLADANFSDYSIAKLRWDVRLPLAPVPMQLLARSSRHTQQLTDSDPAITMAYKNAPVRRTPMASWPRPSGGGYVSAVAGEGAIICSRLSNSVHHVSAGAAGQYKSYSSVRTLALAQQNARPIHAVAYDQDTAFLLCQGSSSNPYPSVKRLSLNPALRESEWLVLGPTYTSVRKGAVNRSGSFLYVIAKKAGDTRHRRLLQINTATKRIRECNIPADDEIMDLCMTDGPRPTGLDAVAFVTKQSSAATAGGQIHIVDEDSDVGGFPSAPGISSIASASTLTMWSVCNAGGQLIVARYSSASTSLTCNVYYVGTLNYGNRTLDSDGSTTITAANGADYPAPGAMIYDGSSVYCLLQNGKAVTFKLGQMSSVSPEEVGVFPVGPSTSAAATTYSDYCGIAFTGRSVIGNLNKTSTDDGYLFHF